ncbi:MAG: helix-turn-helix transcriptional regulator [Odoribacteraceae bacterium]|jgi:AraC-like DNA-binding protein|nr:helix-turn-helix transcriptional regulator [Odoribacteraceae bacterium]
MNDDLHDKYEALTSPEAFHETLSRVTSTLKDLIEREPSAVRRHELSLALDDARALSRCFPHPGRTFAEEILQRAAFLVDQHMKDANFSVNDFADGLGFSRANLYRYMRMATRQTPAEFVRRARVRRAAYLLRHTPARVSEIADMVGFNNLKYFNKHFKKVFGASPTAYRKKTR